MNPPLAIATPAELGQLLALAYAGPLKPVMVDGRPAERRVIVTGIEQLIPLGSWSVTVRQAITAFALLLSLAATASAVEPWQPDNWSRYTRYKRAEYTQAIAHYSDGRLSIEKVPRSSLERKYQVPGGLEHATAWRSDIYRLAKAPEQPLRPIPVLNSFGNYQHEQGYYRAWRDGSRFVDVLTNTATGRVFEVRVAIKGRDRPGEWHRFVDFRDVSQQPPGYRRVRSSECRSCHDEAGSGKYGLGLVPGSDTVISHPFESLEPVVTFANEERPVKKGMLAIAAVAALTLPASAQEPAGGRYEWKNGEGGKTWLWDQQDQRYVGIYYEAWRGYYVIPVFLDTPPTQPPIPLPAGIPVAEPAPAQPKAKVTPPPAPTPPAPVFRSKTTAVFRPQTIVQYVAPTVSYAPTAVQRAGIAGCST